jgi:4-hydroxy-tetrahydrodipicolinate synthase
MPEYEKSDARAWARESMRGVIDVIIPSFKTDLTDINEAGIRHDVRRNIELGFAGALLVSEVSITLSEYARFVEIAAHEADGKQILVYHAMFNTLEENIEGARLASAAGASAALLPYPPGFHPHDEEDVRRYTAAFCDATDLAVILFPLPYWDFERFSPASMSMDLIERLMTDHPNVAVVKAEGGYPSIAGFAQVWRRFADELVVTMPLEIEAVPLMNLVPMQLIATSNTEYFGDRVPRAVKLASEGSLDAAMDLYWSMAPARAANAGVAPAGGTNVVNRTAWKYQAWLNGYNGGPLRVPSARLLGKQMAAFRKALVDSGIEVTSDGDEAFFEGRMPA